MKRGSSVGRTPRKRSRSRSRKKKAEVRKPSKPSNRAIKAQARKLFERFLAGQPSREGARKKRGIYKSNPFGNKLYRTDKKRGRISVFGARHIDRLGGPSEALDAAKRARARMDEERDGRELRFDIGDDKELARIEYVERIARNEAIKRRAIENDMDIQNKGSLFYELKKNITRSETPVRVALFGGLFVATLILFRFIFWPLFI